MLFVSNCTTCILCKSVSDLHHASKALMSSLQAVSSLSCCSLAPASAVFRLSATVLAAWVEQLLCCLPADHCTEGGGCTAGYQLRAGPKGQKTPPTEHHSSGISQLFLLLPRHHLSFEVMLLTGIGQTASGFGFLGGLRKLESKQQRLHQQLMP